MKKIVQKFQSMQVSLKATIAFAISSFAISGINYFTTPIFTRLLTTSEYGVVSVYQSWFTIIQVFATLTLIYPGILNVGLYENKENRWKYLSTILGLSTISSIVLLAIFAVFYREISSVMQLPASIIALMLITFIVSPATTFWTYKQRYEYSYRLPFIISVGSAVLGQIIAILVVYFVTSHKAEWRLWSAGLITIFVGLVLLSLIHI